MFNVVKSAAPRPVFLYNDSDIVALVKSDFSDKCYLCEEKTPRHLEVEHFYPQAIYPHLINDWANLLCICEKCNKIRPKKINTLNDDEVLNCCIDDVETTIKLKYSEINGTIEINSDSSSIKKENTVNLLNKIHNGIATESLSYIALRRMIAEELAELVKEIEYLETTILKSVFKERITKRLSRTSCFSAIKRNFITEEHPILASLFD
jgi:uncharacterized protein (TIGR02646 family)